MGHKTLLAVTRQRKDIGLEGVLIVGGSVVNRNIRLIHRSIRIQSLSMFQVEYRTRFAPDSDPAHSGDIPAQVEDPGGIVDRVEALRVDGFYIPDGRQGLRDDIFRRS